MKKYICENCGKEHDGSYGSGRFCSKSCRMSFIAKNVKHRNVVHVGERSSYGTWQCKRCNLIFETRAKLTEHNHLFHPIPKGSSWNKGLTKETDERIASYVKKCKDLGHYICPTKGISLSEEHRRKTSISMKKFFKEHPDRVPYLLNHSSKESYPEQFFRKAFENEQFPKFTLNKYIKGYFLDFAFEELKVYIEVDGEQHYVDTKIVKHDKIRNTSLNKTEWKCVCRVRWSKFLRLTNELKHAFLIGLKNKIK